MTVIWESCKTGLHDGHDENHMPLTVNVFTGGYVNDNFAGAAGGDTAIPPSPANGNHIMETSEGGDFGFRLRGDSQQQNGHINGSPNRTGIEMHGGAHSEGCIVAPSGNAAWIRARALINGCNMNCIHDGAKKTSVPVTVVYATNEQPDPNSNQNDWQYG